MTQALGFRQDSLSGSGDPQPITVLDPVAETAHAVGHAGVLGCDPRIGRVWVSLFLLHK